MKYVSGLTAMTLVLCATAVMAQEAKDRSADAAAGQPDRTALEKRFAERMSGATMVGHFTDTSKEKSVSPKEEKYSLLEVKKLEGKYWLFKARIQYGEHDATLPLSVPVEWAGDTPVISITNLGIPGFGTFTARVLFYDDHYAGTWSGGGHGGHLFGKIVHEDAER